MVSTITWALDPHWFKVIMRAVSLLAVLQSYDFAYTTVLQPLENKATQQLHRASLVIQRVFRNQYTFNMIQRVLKLTLVFRQQKLEADAATKLQYVQTACCAMVNVRGRLETTHFNVVIVLLGDTGTSGAVYTPAWWSPATLRSWCTRSTLTRRPRSRIGTTLEVELPCG